MTNILNIPKEELGKGSRIAFEIVDTEDDIYYDIAREMYETIEQNNKTGKPTAFVLPVGPIGQYGKLARMVNRSRLSLTNVYVFNMDEYMISPTETLSPDSPLSFRHFMNEAFYSLVDRELNIPEQNRFFPEPGREWLIEEKINALGGLDMSIGGVGINGHIAFNEPPEDGDAITDEAFQNLKTRVLKISRETRTINAAMAAGGCIDLIPEWCITVGMKEILSAKKLRFYMNRFWQRGIVRKVLHGKVTRHVPASFLQEHPDAKLVVTAQVAELPSGRLV